MTLAQPIPWAGRNQAALRPETEMDDAFLRTLFATASTALDGLPGAVAQPLLDMQFRSQTVTYRARHPHARFSVVTMNGVACGRLVFDPAPARVIDFGLLPEYRRLGLGAAILSAVLGQADGPVGCTVLATNTASLAMCRRLGFRVVADSPPYLELSWLPGQSALT